MRSLDGLIRAHECTEDSAGSRTEPRDPELPCPSADPRDVDRGALPLDALDGDRAPTAADVAAVHRLRAALRAAIDEPDAAATADRAAALAAAAGTPPALHRDDEGAWRWHTRSRPGASVADELALLTGTALLGVLRALGHDRFRRCAAPTCAGVFVDTSRAGRRRYCEPDLCGNRVNVAAFRARRRGAAG